MRKSDYRVAVLLVVAATFALALAAAATATTAGPQVAGRITSDGSSTVGPYTQAAAERFERANRGARVVVGISGTGGGFERFCRGEIDLSNASRPIKLSEAKKCQDNGVQYIQFLVANDGLSIVINKSNNWVDCLTQPELRKIWDKGSKVNSWRDVRSSFPDVPLRLFGAGTDSGTFDFFTEKINGKSGQSRSDYVATEDDNVTVRGVAGDRGGMGYFGLSYYIENKGKLKVLKIHNGTRCVGPSTASVQATTYKPLARPLFIYAKRSSFRRPVVRAFIRFMIQNERSIATRARFVPLTKKQLAKAKRQYNAAVKAG